MPSHYRSGLGLLLLGVSLFATLGLAAEPEKTGKPLAEGTKGVVVGTTGRRGVEAGLEVLKQGGSAADAAAATALTQVVECAGGYVSHAGILGMVYYDAATGKVTALNACYDIPSQEKDPLTIPKTGTPSGRTALVPGFMAGILAMHERFGKLPREAVFEPAAKLAEDGFTVEPFINRMLQSKKDLLGRLPEAKAIFYKPDGIFVAAGDVLHQRQLAATLRATAKGGVDYFYRGPWAEHFVAAVQKEGGVVTLDDLKNYHAIWEEPLTTEYRDFQAYVPGKSSAGGLTMIEALRLLQHADLRSHGPHATSPESLFWLMQISSCQVLMFLSPEQMKGLTGRELTPEERLKPETTKWIWEQMQAGKWPFAAHKTKSEQGQGKEDKTPKHSDGIVVVDQWGNVAAVTHSINTVLWGTTGIFVDGISIPDSACFQQDAMKRFGAGKRLPDPMCPLVVLKNGKPVLGSSAIGGGLHQKTLQVLSNVLDFGQDAQSAVEAPAFMVPNYQTTPPTAQVERSGFSEKHLDAVRALGQQIKVLTPQESGLYRGYWVGVQVGDGMLKGAGSHQLPSYAAGY